MAREIDLVLGAAGRGCLVVEKTSHVLWTGPELAAACRVGCYPDEDTLGPPTEHPAVSGPYPGCLQQTGAATDFGQYPLLGQTEHFLIFAPPEAEGAVPPTKAS